MFKYCKPVLVDTQSLLLDICTDSNKYAKLKSKKNVQTTLTRLSNEMCPICILYSAKETII